LSQLPPLDLNVRRVPPIAISLQQQLDMTSHYTMRARLFGLNVMQLEIQGKTKIAPQDCARREQSRSHERSFPDVAAAGNPAIPTRVVETCVKTVTHAASPQHHHRAAPRPLNAGALNAGARRFDYSLERAASDAAPTPPATDSAVRFGG
jgi:hypothetical protein